MRRRIIICLGLLLTLCLLGDVIAMVCLAESVDELTGIADAYRIQSMRAELASSAVHVQSDVLAYLDGRRSAVGRKDAAVQQFADAHRQCNECHHEAWVQRDLNALGAAFAAYRKTVGEVAARDAERAPDGQAKSRSGLIERQLQELSERLVQQTTDLAHSAARHVTVQSTDATISVRNAWLVLSGTLGVAMLVGGFVAFHLERRLTRPVASLLEGIEHARQGDLAHQFSFDADEEFRRLAHAFEDAYRSLDTAHAKIVQGEKMAAVGRLAAGVAHEVANPLASISAVAQVMRRQPSAEDQGIQINIIMEEIGRISRIIRELLTFSRPAAGAAYDRVDIGALLDRVTVLLAYDKRAEKVRLICHRENAPFVWGDADRLLLVFTNIVLNAFDAVSSRGKGDGTLTISSRHEENCVAIRFEDDGPGMNEEQLARAFEPFFTTKEPGVGTGLGLWVSYRVVQEHRGGIELQSRKGTGTTVTVKLPAAQPGQDVLTAGANGI
ncbi:MAG: hypothetical protein JSU86_11075 [Phycisphaerales bacterium]|nr:MAG: hypothetical protein JSU86_11075 [Phycisphaerales bacterium]